MESKPRVLEYTVWAVLALVTLGIASAFFWSRFNARPPLPVYGQLDNFVLTNQTGEAVSLRMLRGEVWLADVIFTRCAGPCPKMSAMMAELSKELAEYSSLRLVSLTADPAFDTREVLSRYAQEFGAQPDRWFFLTGPKVEINRLAINSLKLAVVEKEEAERTDPADLFIHSTLIALVDGRGQLRGFFAALEPGAKEKIVTAVKTLLKDP